MTLILGCDWLETSEEWLIPGLICDSLTLLSGEPKSGKTSLAGHLIRSLILHQEILGLMPMEGDFKICWMGTDSKWQRELQDRIPDLMSKVYFKTLINFKDDEGWVNFIREISETGISLVVIDHLYGLGAGADLDRQIQTQEVLMPLQKLIDKSGAAVLLLAQAGKGSFGRAAHSVALEGFARCLIRLRGTSKNRVLESIANNSETTTWKIRLSPKELEYFGSDRKIKSELSDADGALPNRARFIIENASPDYLKSVKDAGRWLSEKDPEIGNPESGRAAVNYLIKAGLLARKFPKGPICAGPKLFV